MFTPRAIRKLYRLSRGIPRLINVIADRALLAAYTRDEHRIGSRLVGHAAKEVFGRRPSRRWLPWAAGALGLSLLAWFALTRDIGNNRELQLAMADPAPAAAAASAGESAEGSATETLSSLLASADLESATAALFAAWGVERTPGDETVCEQLATEALRCLRLSGRALAELERLDRPVRIEVFDDGGQPRYLLLAALGETQASVQIGGEAHRVPIAELARLRFGDALLLWRPAIRDVSESLVEGARGSAVIWLRTALEEISGESLDSSEPDLFDAALAEAVSRYQHDQGMTASGAADELTVARLQADLHLVGVSLGSRGP